EIVADGDSGRSQSRQPSFYRTRHNMVPSPLRWRSAVGRPPSPPLHVAEAVAEGLLRALDGLERLLEEVLVRAVEVVGVDPVAGGLAALGLLHLVAEVEVRERGVGAEELLRHGRAGVPLQRRDVAEP